MTDELFDKPDPQGRLQSRGFPKSPPQNRASTPLNKWFGYRREKE